MKSPATFNDLVEAANQHHLYQKLIEQLNKDFRFAAISFEIEQTVSPNELKIMLHETIYNLIQQNFSNYLNLLYIIDVSEIKIKQLDGNDTLKLAEDVSFLILKREWQKVWFRNTFG